MAASLRSSAMVWIRGISWMKSTYSSSWIRSYNASLHTTEGLQSMLKGTFMEGNVRTGAVAAGSTSGGSSSGSTSGSSSSGSSKVITVGPGVSGGNPGVTSSTPGKNEGSSSGSASQTPSSDGDHQVRLEGPSASISRNRAELFDVSVVIGVGPGAASSNNGSTAGSSPSVRHLQLHRHRVWLQETELRFLVSAMPMRS
ncbi:MAG: hypothetical protein ACLUD2_06650 [Clostridium sp.]